MLCSAPLVAVARHVAGVAEMAQSAVLNLLQFALPEQWGMFAFVLEVGYNIRLITRHGGVGTDFGKEFFLEKLSRTL